MNTDLIVAVRTSAVSRAPHKGNHAALVHMLSFINQNSGIMPIPRNNTIGMFYFHKVSVAADPACLRDSPRSSRRNRCAVIASNIYSFMEGRSDTARTGPVSVVAGNRTRNWPYVRRFRRGIYNRADSTVGLVHKFGTECDDKTYLLI